MRDRSSQIKLGAIISYIGIFIGIVTMFLYTPWMIRKIGQSDYGLYTLAMSLANIFIFDFGLSKAVNKIISKNVAKGEDENNNNIVGSFYRFYFYIGVLLSLVLLVVYLLIPNIYSSFSGEELFKFKNIFVMISIYSVVSFMFIPQNGILYGYQRFVFAKFMDLLHKILSTSLIILALISGKGLYSIVIGTVVSGIAIIIWKQIIIKKKLNIRINFKYRNRQETIEIIKVSAWSAIISFSQRFLFTITPAILGALATPYQVAVFGIITSIEGNFYTVGAALNGLFLTKNTIDIEENNLKSIQLDYSKLTMFTVFFMGLILVGFSTIGRQFISLWVGEGFDYAFLGTIIVLLPTYLYLPNEIPNNILLIKNNLKSQGVVYLIMAILNISLTFLLIPKLGVIGSALSIGIAYLFRNIAMWFVYYKKINIDWRQYFFKVYFIVIIPIILMILGYIIGNHLKINNYIDLAFYVVLIGVFYIIIISPIILKYKKMEVF